MGDISGGVHGRGGVVSGRVLSLVGYVTEMNVVSGSDWISVE